jgi:protein gp37
MFQKKDNYFHATFRPWSGCTKISPGCEHCHDERLAHRFTGSWGAEWGADKPRKRTSESTWKQPLAWNRRAAKDGTRYRVLTLGGDVFDIEIDQQGKEDWRDHFFELVKETPNLDWLVLTKRPELAAWYGHRLGTYPANVLLGLTVCNQHEADGMIPILLSIAAAHYWLSIEPMLGPVYLTKPKLQRPICFVVLGCESGPGARPMHYDWARSVRDQCITATVPFYLKQMMINGKLVHNPELDGQKWEQIPD